MFKFVVFAALVACVAGDAGGNFARGEPLGLSEYNAPQQSQQSYSAPQQSQQVYSNDGGDSSDGAQLDEGLLRQISQILGSSGSSSSGSSRSYQAPQAQYNAPSRSPQPQYNAPQPQRNNGGYGAPSRQGGSIQLGHPEMAQRVAEFELSGGSTGGNTRQSYGAPSQGGY